ncbi:MAG: hypothetical protein AAGB35_01740 [Pseudomonadota bacterium]
MHQTSQASELVIKQRDIDFSDKTVSVLTKDLLKQIHIASNAVCETPQALKFAIESGLAKIGGYQSEQGSWIYLNLNNHNYVIPYVRNH